MDIERGAVAAVTTLTRIDFLTLCVDDRLKTRRIDREMPDDLVVEHDRSATGDRTERELRLLWSAQFADDEDVERRGERGRDRVCDRHASPRKAEHQDVGSTAQILQQCGQLAAGVLPIRKDGPIMDLDRFQALMRDTYGERDRARGTPAAVAWLAEEVGELAQAVRKGTPEQQLVELADVLAWLASIAEQLGLSLDDATRRYASGCPRCGEIPCRCPL